jgi:hypothetical protein
MLKPGASAALELCKVGEVVPVANREPGGRAKTSALTE